MANSYNTIIRPFGELLTRFLSRLGDEESEPNANSLHLSPSKIHQHAMALRAHLFDGAALPADFPGEVDNIVEQIVEFKNGHMDHIEDIELTFDDTMEDLPSNNNSNNNSSNNNGSNNNNNGYNSYGGRRLRGQNGRRTRRSSTRRAKRRATRKGRKGRKGTRRISRH